MKKDVLSWDDIRIFLACARTGSFRQAGALIGMAPMSVSRHINHLEEQLSFEMFERLPQGLNLTEAGEVVLQKAEEIEDSLLAMLHDLPEHPRTDFTAVKIAATEGLGSYWIMPKLIQMQQNRPEMNPAHLILDMESADVMRQEADISVQFAKPEKKDQITSRIGYLHACPYASEQYLATYGAPRSIDDLANHRLVLQKAPQVDSNFWGRSFGDVAPIKTAPIITNVSTAHFHAIAGGGGIGLLPNYAMALGARLTPIDIKVEEKIEIHLTFPQGARQNRAKSKYIDWLKDIFSEKNFKWFGAEFIPPADLARDYMGTDETPFMGDYFRPSPQE